MEGVSRKSGSESQCSAAGGSLLSLSPSFQEMLYISVADNHKLANVTAQTEFTEHTSSVLQSYI